MFFLFIYLYPYFCVFLLSSSCSSPASLPSPAVSHAAFDFHTSLTLVFNPIPKPSSLVSWSQICLLNSIAVIETGRPYQLKNKRAQYDYSTQCDYSASVGMCEIEREGRAKQKGVMHQFTTTKNQGDQFGKSLKLI